MTPDSDDQSVVTVLLIENHELEARLIQDTLSRDKNHIYDVALVFDLKSALAILDNRVFDVILSDIDVTDSSCFHTLKALKDKTDTPVLILIDEAHSDNVDTALKAGALDYIVKEDKNIEEVSKKISMAIERSGYQTAMAEAQRMKKAFLSSMSHGIRTPLHGIIGMSQNLQRTTLNSVQQNYVSTIMDSGAALLYFVSDILDYSSLEAGELQLKPEAIELREIAMEVVSSLNELAISKGVELLVDCDEDVPHAVELDPDRLKQVLRNLAAHALQSVDEGHVVIQIRKIGGDDEEAMILFAVEDTGPGLSQEKEERIFEDFNDDVEISEINRCGYTALGMSVSSRLVRLMGGEIGVIGKGDQGSKFWMKISCPVSKRDSTTQDVEIYDALKDDKILIVDDSAFCLILLSLYLKKAGIECETAADEVSAFNAIDKAAADGKPFTICVIDYSMPDLNGVEIAQVLRNEKNLDDMKIMLITAEESPKVFEPYIGNVIDDYLFKPFLAEEFGAKLYEVTHGLTDLREKQKSKHKEEEMFPISANVLLVEDEKINQTVGVEMLEGFGCKVDVVDNGEQAVQKVSQQKYDVVLMDCMMPVMDGFEATKEIRKLEEKNGESPQIIIALTANVMDGAKEYCFKSGMNDYLAKPVKNSDLHRALLKHISVNQNAGEMSKGQLAQAVD